MGSLRLFAPEFSAIEARKQQRGWEGAPPESDVALHGVRPLTPLPMRWCHVWVFFFFFGIHADLALIFAKTGRFGQNQDVSAESNCIGQQPKSALNHVWTTEIGYEWGLNILTLSFLNFILNICCFFCVFFFVLWTKAIVMCFLRMF